MKRLQTRKLGIRTIAFVLCDRHFLLADFARFLVHDVHHRGYRNDFRIKISSSLRRGSALLRLQGIFVHGVAANIVTLRYDFGSLQHRHVNRIVHFYQFTVGLNAHFLGLHQRNRFLSASGHDIDIVDDDVLCSRSNRHQTRRTLAVHRHARYRNGQTSAQRNLACKIAALRTLLKRGAPEHVVDFAAFDAGALNSSL